MHACMFLVNEKKSKKNPQGKDEYDVIQYNISVVKSASTS